MQGEMLDLDNEGLPADLAGEWLALGPVPKGKRCMAVTFTKTRRSKSGRSKMVSFCVLAEIRLTMKPSDKYDTARSYDRPTCRTAICTYLTARLCP